MGGARGGRPPPLSLDQTEVRKAEKEIFCRLLPPSPYLKVWIRHCKRGKLGNKIPRLL